jgi:hypothetical protein
MQEETVIESPSKNTGSNFHRPISCPPTTPRRGVLGSGKVTNPNTHSCKRFMFCDVPPVLRRIQGVAEDKGFFRIMTSRRFRPTNKRGFIRMPFRPLFFYFVLENKMRI